MDAKDQLRLKLWQAAIIAAPAAKAVGDDYAARLQAIADKPGDKESHKTELLALLALIAWLAYQEGMKRGGIVDPEKHMTAGDIAYVGAWITAQTAFIPGLAQAIADYQAMEDGAEKAKAREALDARLALWVATLAALTARGYTSAQGDKMGVWRYGDTDHCETCLGLNGRRERLSWFVERGYIPREPGSQTLDCRGYRCQCGIYSDTGERLL